jgi:hypothetical protein
MKRLYQTRDRGLKYKTRKVQLFQSLNELRSLIYEVQKLKIQNET